MTLKAVADHDPKTIINYVHDVRQKYYESLSTFDAFGRGWSARNKSTLKSALELSKPSIAARYGLPTSVSTIVLIQFNLPFLLLGDGEEAGVPGRLLDLLFT